MVTGLDKNNLIDFVKNKLTGLGKNKFTVIEEPKLRDWEKMMEEVNDVITHD